MKKLSRSSCVDGHAHNACLSGLRAWIRTYNLTPGIMGGVCFLSRRQATAVSYILHSEKSSRVLIYSCVVGQFPSVPSGKQTTVSMAVNVIHNSFEHEITNLMQSSINVESKFSGVRRVIQRFEYNKSGGINGETAAYLSDWEKL